MSPDLDVVVVPDFHSKRAPVFEARTLFFLASWIENAGPARRFPLHLACIGKPPASVCRLAARCDAKISVHEPITANRGRFANKLRGLEVQGRADRVLLLDADVLVLGDFSDLAGTGDGLAAARSPRQRVPEEHWRRIYGALGLDLPPEDPMMERAGRSRFPYYNSGVVLAPRDCGLRVLWEEHMRRIAALFDEHDPAWRAVAASDQAGFATSVAWLTRRGVPLRPLPAVFNAGWKSLYHGRVELSSVKLFHAYRLFEGVDAGPHELRRGLGRYRRALARQMLDEYRSDFGTGTGARDGVKRLLPALVDAWRVGRRLQHLYRLHVVSALEHTC